MSSGKPITLQEYDDKYMDIPFEILHVNHELQIIYTSVTSLSCQSATEFNTVLLQAKKAISNRPYILDRFEQWEVVGGFEKWIRMALMGRSRNDTERKLVRKYISTLKGIQ